MSNHVRFVHFRQPSRLFSLLKSLKILDTLESEIYNPATTQFHSNKKIYLTIKIDNVESLFKQEIIANDEILRIYHTYPNINILYDFSVEALLTTDFVFDQLEKLHAILRSNNVNSKNVILVCANPNFHLFYKTWLQKNNLPNDRIKILGYHFYLYEFFWEINACTWIQNNSQQIAQSAQNTVLAEIKRKKHYMCLNLKPRAHRAALILHLLERDHLNKGSVSYFGNELGYHVSPDVLPDQMNFLSNLKSKDRLINNLDKLNKLTPIILNKNSNEIEKQLWKRMPGQVEFFYPEGDLININGFDNYFEIITETWLTDSSTLYITEKTVRPILRLQPFIHVGSPYLLKYLRSIGFQTFSPFIDESYDEIEDPYERIELIFNEIDRLCNMTIDEIHNLYSDLWPRVLYNYKHFTFNTPTIAKNDITNNILLEL